MPKHVVVKLLVLAIWFLSVYLHEVGHAAAAWWGGDRGVAARGGFSPVRMWFNNVWISLVLPAILLLLTGFAFPGAATRVDRASLRSRGVVSLVFLAGPAATALVTLLLAGAYALTPGGLMKQTLALSVFWNVMSFILNLLPLPSLDGFGAIAAHLPGRIERGMYRLAVPAIVLLILVFVAIPRAAAAFSSACLGGARLLGVSESDFLWGLGYFRDGLGRLF